MRFPNLRTFSKALWHFFARPEIAPDSVRRDRAARCAQCPHFQYGQCQVCTCFVAVKTLLATEKCPDKPARWGEYFNTLRTGL